MLTKELLPPLKSFFEGPSTVNWVAVVACTVVISASEIPNSSCKTFATGARQLVVQDALETIKSLLLASLWFTPITNIGASGDGAEITTFFAPPSMCNCAFSKEVKIPVHSATISVSTLFQLICLGSLSAVILIILLSTTKFPSLTSIEASHVPWTESYFKRYAKWSTSNKSLIPTTWTSFLFKEARKTILPILPNPLIPNLIFDIILFFYCDGKPKKKTTILLLKKNKSYLLCEIDNFIIK